MVLEKYPNDIDTLYNKANILLEFKMYDFSLQIFNKVLIIKIQKNLIFLRFYL